MRNKSKSIAFYGTVAFISLFLYYWPKTADSDILRFLLYPHAKLTEIYYNLPMKYIAGTGYTSIEGSFAIGRECMGSSFIVMLFAMTSTMFERYFAGVKKYLWLAVSLIGSTIIGILVSSIRIIGSIPFVTNPKFGLFHSGIGISLYFLTLLASYAILKLIFRGEKSEEIV